MVILLMVVPCMAVSTAEISSLFLSVVTVVSALPAVINIPWIALPLCPLSSLMSDTVIAFFTIDASLRDFFLQDRSLLNCLFHSVSSVVLRLFSKMNKHKNFTPGFIMVLHTFGRDLKWNPHIHCLISEGGYSDDAFWRNVSHFNYTFLRNAFRTALLKEMLLRIRSFF